MGRFGHRCPPKSSLDAPLASSRLVVCYCYFSSNTTGYLQRELSFPVSIERCACVMGINMLSDKGSFRFTRKQ